MAVEDIRISLQLLTEMVENLEQQIEEKEAERAQAEKAAAKATPAKNAPQIDMFGGWTGRPANDKNNVLLAKKLDNTIDRIQALLKEGAA